MFIKGKTERRPGARTQKQSALLLLLFYHTKHSHLVEHFLLQGWAKPTENPGWDLLAVPLSQSLGFLPAQQSTVISAKGSSHLSLLLQQPEVCCGCLHVQNSAEQSQTATLWYEITRRQEPTCSLPPASFCQRTPGNQERMGALSPKWNLPGRLSFTLVYRNT